VNTLFRLALYITIILMLFNLGWGLLRSLDGTVFAESSDQSAINASTDMGVMQQLTGISPSEQNIWGFILTIGAAASLLFSWMVHSLVPTAMYLFGVGFWGSYNATLSAVNIGGYIPGEFMLLVTAAMGFLFLGAMIGLMTGNG